MGLPLPAQQRVNASNTTKDSRNLRQKTKYDDEVITVSDKVIEKLSSAQNPC
jgi:hypothetical protein